MPEGSNHSLRGGPPGEKRVTDSVISFPQKRPPDNLPLQLSSFVGREREVAEVGSLLGDGARLVTLCGPGGCGKTRLALAVTQEMVEGFEDGVWWVELASLSAPDLVSRALASALGVREVPDRPLTELLAEHLEPRKALVVLDNCEHLVEGCAALAETLLRTCPDLKILATSRESLRIAGESSWPVPSLSVPDPGRRFPAEELERYEAVRLFVERAGAVDAGFALTERNATAVAQLCRKLDGIPLAIELAAARVRVLSVEQILGRLEDPLSLLTTGSRTAALRHQTLRAALEWSYELLSEQERELLERLSAFTGGWDLEAAEVVGAGGTVRAGMVLDLLSALVDKSLVMAGEREEEGSSLSYMMLVPVKQFAREKLQETAEEPEVRRRHAEYYLALAEMAEPELLGPDQGRWLARLRTEAGNLRAALSWTLEPGQEEERAEWRLRLVAALGRFWGRENFEEGKQWLRTALEKDPGGFPAFRAKTLGELGFILLFQQDFEPAIDALDEAVALYKELGDRSGAAFALASLGWAVLHGYYRERVLAFVREGEALIEGGLEGPPRAYLSIILAAAMVWQGDLDLAYSRITEAIAMSRELGNQWNVDMALFNLGGIHLRRGDTERAMEAFEEGARISGQLGDMLGAAYYVWIYGGMNARMGRPIRAAGLWAAAEVLREQMGMSFSRYDLAESGYEGDLAAVRAALDEATFGAAWAEGRSMSLQEAIAYALEERQTPHQEEDVHPPASETSVLRVFALGAARVERRGRALTSSDWTYTKPKELFYYLLTYPEGRTKEQIGLALWPEASSSRLRSSFHDTLYHLRRALGGKEWISFEKGRYYFDRSLSYSYDVEAFEWKLSEARRLRTEAPEQAIRHLQEAADLYRGDFLEDLAADGEWALERQEEQRRAYQEVMLLLGRLLFIQARYAEAADAYRKAISHDRFVEEAHRELMRSLAALGERGRALRHYEELVALLEEQLGTPPAPESRALYERLRAGEEL